MSNVELPIAYESELTEMSTDYTTAAKAISDAKNESTRYTSILSELTDVLDESVFEDISDVNKSLQEITELTLGASFSFTAIVTSLIEGMNDFLSMENFDQIFDALVDENGKVRAEYENILKELGKSKDEKITEEDIAKLLESDTGINALTDILKDESSDLFKSAVKKSVESLTDKGLLKTLSGYGIDGIETFISSGNFESLIETAADVLVSEAKDAFAGKSSILTQEITDQLLTKLGAGSALLSNAIGIFGTVGVNIISASIEKEGILNLKAEDYESAIGDMLVGLLGTAVETSVGTASVTALGVSISLAPIAALTVSVFGSLAVKEVVNELNYIDDVIPRNFEPLTDADVEAFKETQGIEIKNRQTNAWNDKNVYVATTEMRKEGYSDEIINLTSYAAGDTAALNDMICLRNESGYEHSVMSPEIAATIEYIDTYGEDYVMSSGELEQELINWAGYTQEECDAYIETYEKLRAQYDNADNQVIATLRESIYDIRNDIEKELYNINSQHFITV